MEQAKQWILDKPTTLNTVEVYFWFEGSETSSHISGFHTAKWAKLSQPLISLSLGASHPESVHGRRRAAHHKYPKKTNTEGQWFQLGALFASQDKCESRDKTTPPGRPIYLSSSAFCLHCTQLYLLGKQAAARGLLLWQLPPIIHLFCSFFWCIQLQTMISDKVRLQTKKGTDTIFTVSATVLTWVMDY